MTGRTGDTADSLALEGFGARSALALLIIAYCLLYAAAHFLSVLLQGQLHLQGTHQKAALTVSVSAGLLWSMFLVVYLILRLRGQTLGSIGWHAAAPLRGWLAALVLCALYGALMLAGPLRNAPFLSDWSVFRITAALAAGLSAGICEETIFRGFVMTQSRDAGMPVTAQILISGLLFGLAHAGWGGAAGHFSASALLGSVGTTFVLGVLFATVYLVSRRSLLPVVVAHAGIDLLIEPWLILYALGGGFTHG